MGVKYLKEFEDLIRKIIEEKCDDYFLGIADLTLAKNDILEQGEPFFAEYPRAISVGITLPYTITNELSISKNSIYNETSYQLNIITAHLGSILQEEGYKALHVPKTEYTDGETFIFLHKLAANLANLGKIENNLLVTPEVGSGVNWGTVLTDAPLESIGL